MLGGLPDVKLVEIAVDLNPTPVTCTEAIMHTRVKAGLAVFAGLLVALAVPVGSPRAAGAAETADALASAGMGCKITVTASNSSSTTSGFSAPITIEGEKSRVRAYIKVGPAGSWGTWKSLKSMGTKTVSAGGKLSTTVDLDLGCSAPRQYEFHVTRQSSSALKKIPGGTSSTTLQTISLGDLYALFK